MYNTQLKNDTATRLKPFNKVSVHTFHGFVSQIYRYPCPDNTSLKSYLVKRRNSVKRETVLEERDRPDILIVDEVQDLSSLLYELVLWICYDADSFPQLIILGDRDQVYGYFLGLLT